jgi:Protein of unknown function (DUF2490)
MISIPGKNLVTTMALAILFSLEGHAADPREDAEFWNELKITAKWTDQVDLIAAGALRFEDNFSVLNRRSLQLGLNLRPIPWLTLTPNYQYIAHDPAEDVRTHEHRPSLLTAVRIPIERAEVTLSTGIEYRIREDKEDSWRVRPKVKLKYPLGPDQWNLSGYIADELFYDSNHDDFVRNRSFAGCEKKLGKSWSIDLYYCRQQDLHGRDPDLDVVGLSIGVRFDLAPLSVRSQPAEK